LFLAIVEAKMSSGFGAVLFKKLDAEPEHYEVVEKHPTGVGTIRYEGGNIIDALARFNQVVEELVMADKRRET
jgi:hypothetical protein